MARYYKIRIAESLWLTDDGSENGRPCKVDVIGIGFLIPFNIGQVSVGADGTPFRETPLNPSRAGLPITLIIRFLPSAVYANLLGLLDAAAEDATVLRVEGSDALTADFDVDVIVNDNPTYISTGGQSGDNLRDVAVNLITAGDHA